MLLVIFQLLFVLIKGQENDNIVPLDNTSNYFIIITTIIAFIFSLILMIQ